MREIFWAIVACLLGLAAIGNLANDRLGAGLLFLGLMLLAVNGCQKRA